MMPTNHPLISPELLRGYARQFVNRWDTYLGLSLDGHWVRRQRRLTAGYLQAALRGEVALGLYSVNQRGLSRWVCLDLDDAAHGAALERLIARLPDPQQAVLEASRRGWHLWLLTEPTPWAQARAWGRLLAATAGLDTIEVFPKGGGLNGVRAPLTPHPKDGQVYPLLELSSGEVVADPLALIASRRPGPVPPVPADEPAAPAGGASTPQGLARDRTDHAALVAEVERYTRLRFYGPERAIGRCPFHDDHHPSLSLVGGFWRCWAGCGEGGLAAFRARVNRMERR